MNDYADAPAGSEAVEDTKNTLKAKAPDADFLPTAKAWFRRDLEHWTPWRKAAVEAFDFAALRQISDADKEKLRAEMRPHVVFDRIGPVISAVSGMEIQNRQETKYLPRTMGDVQVNEVLTSAGKYMTEQCGAEVEDSDAFLDSVICGLGWTEARLDYDDDPEGSYIRERIDPLEMIPAADARKRNLIDAKRLWRVREMPTADAQEMFPGHEPCDLHAYWASDLDLDAEEPHNADKRLSYNQDEGGPKVDPGETCRIVHLQWREREVSHVSFVDPFTGQAAEAGLGEFGVLKERMEALGSPIGQSQTVMKNCWYQVFIGAELLGEKTKNLCPDRPTWECITGKRDRNKGTFYGLVAAMMDPQRWANKWLSQALHIMNLQAKGGVIAERGAFENDAEAEASWADPSRFTWAKPGTLSGQSPRIQPKVAPNLPAGPEKFLELAISAIRDSSGVNLELLGLRDANQPGVLEAQRKQAGMTILAGLFDNLRFYRERTGRTLLHYITNYLSDGRLIRIVGEENEQYVPLVHALPDTVKFDVVVDDAPTSPNQKEQIWGMLLQMMPMLKDMLPPQAWLKLAKYSPLPSSVVQEVAEATEQAMAQRAEQPNPEMMKVQAQIQAQQAKTELDAQAKQTELAMEARAGQVEMASSIQAMREKAAADIQIAREKAEADIRVMMMKASADIQIAQMKGTAQAARAAAQPSKDAS